jgi:hypothetical protein
MGCYVLVIKPQPGIPDGCPDVVFMKEGFWGSIEVKKDEKADYQPLQRETIEKHNEWSWSRRVDPTNWTETKIELEMIL